MFFKFGKSIFKKFSKKICFYLKKKECSCLKLILNNLDIFIFRYE